MTNYDEQGRRIAKLLDTAADELPAEQRARLIEARQLALSRQCTQTASQLVPALAGTVSGMTERSIFGVRYLIPVAVLVLGLFGVAYMHNGGSSDISEIDTALLTDDLPISAYLDTGFDSWLKRSSR